MAARRDEELKAQLASQLQRAALIVPRSAWATDANRPHFDAEAQAEQSQAVYQDSQQIAETIDALIQLRITEAINGLQAGGYIPI